MNNTNICLHLSGLEPYQLKLIPQILENAGEKLYSYRREKLLEGRPMQGYLGFCTGDGEWQTYSTPRTHHIVSFKRFLELFNYHSLKSYETTELLTEIESRGYYAFPAAPEGPFPDLSGFKPVPMLVGSHKSLTEGIVCKRATQEFISATSGYWAYVSPIPAPKTLRDIFEEETGEEEETAYIEWLEKRVQQDNY